MRFTRNARKMLAQSLLGTMMAGGMGIAQGPPPNKPGPPSHSPNKPSPPPSQGPNRPPNPSKPPGQPGKPPGQGPNRPPYPPKPGPSRPPGPPPQHGPSRPPGPPPRPPGPGPRPPGPGPRPPNPRPPGPPPHQWRPPRPPGAGGGYVHYDQWRRGYRLPPDYWNRGIVIVNYGPYHLHPPPPGYQWRYIDGNYVLAAVATGIISSVIIAAAMQ